MSTATIKVQTQADLQALLGVTRGVQDLTAAVQQLNAATGAGGAVGGAPPGMAAASAASGGPPPPPVPTTPQGARGMLAAGGGHQTGAPPPPPAAPPPTMGPPSMAGAARPAGAARGGGLGRLGTTVAGTATGMALGTSISGFILGSGERFMELDRIMTRLGRRFRQADDNAAGFGASLGLTIGQTAQLVDTMGAATNAVDRAAFLRQGGFARQMGMDPGAGLQTFGQMERMMGRERTGVDDLGRPTFRQQRLTESQLGQLAGEARLQGMSQGRMGEMAAGVAGRMQSMAARAGSADFNAAMATQAMPSMVFGQTDPRGRGVEGERFLGQFQSMMTGSPAMRATLTRAIGFGQEGNDISFMELQKRLEAGVEDHRNVTSLFGMFQQRGLSTQGMQQALLPFAKQAGMSADVVEKLVDAFDTPEKLRKFTMMSEGGRTRRMAAFTGGLTDEERAAFEQGGMGPEGLGGMPGRIGRGEVRRVELEAMTLAVGDAVSQAMVDLTASAGNLVGLMEQLVGQDLGEALTGVTGALRDVTGMLEALPEGGGALGFLKNLSGGVGAGGVLPAPNYDPSSELFSLPWHQDTAGEGG